MVKLIAAALAVAALTVVAGGAQSALVPQPRVFQGVQPQLAKLGNRVFLAFGQDNVISVLSSADGGQTFGQAVELKVPGRVSLGMHRGPRIAATGTTVIVSVVAGGKGGGADGDVLLYRSTNSGATWSAPVVINDVPGAPREGLHAMAATPAGLVTLAWLDLREKGTRIYTAVSRDHGVTWSRDNLAYESPSGSVCECCHPSAAINNGGMMALMFRNNVDGNRDMYVSRSRDWMSFSPPQKSGAGSWPLNACPMDGGAVVFQRTDVISVWRRENDVYLATLGKPEKRIGAGRDPAIDRLGEHQDIAWSSPTGMMLMRDDHEAIKVGDGRFPAIASLEQRTIVAWESQGAVKILSVAR
ncbi:MAG: sialidase family protein [Vicinamibacterales bacterium]